MMCSPLRINCGTVMHSSGPLSQILLPQAEPMHMPKLQRDLHAFSRPGANCIMVRKIALSPICGFANILMILSITDSLAAPCTTFP